MKWSPLLFQLAGKPFCETTLLTLVPQIRQTSCTGSTPLHYAALRKDVRFVEFLLANGAEVNRVNNFGETPLHWAVKAGREQVVSLLLESGAQVDLLDSENLSALDWALEEEQTHLVPLLNSKKTQVHRPSRRWRTRVLATAPSRT